MTTLAMLLSVAFVIVLFAYNRVHTVADGLADQAGELLANVEDELDGLDRTQRMQWIARNAKLYTAHLVPIDDPHAPASTMLPRRFMTRALAEALRHRIAGVSAVLETDAPHRQLWVRVEMLGTPVWLVLPLGRFRRDPTWQFVVAAAMFALAALSVSALFAWRVNRPLRDLRDAAVRLGRGERPEPLSEAGPREVEELATAFNSMLTDLAANERERDVMLAGISHDLRTPLARLRLGVEMMKDASLQDGMREDIEDIERILGQFIAYSRGLGVEDAVRCDPGQVARDVAARYAREQCMIALVLEDDLPLITMRPLAITRALNNLIDNARRYGALPITLRLRRQRGCVLFEVADCGPGIPAHQLGDALKPFHRLDSARRADGGSGLGFAIVDRIARLHGGRVRLRNRPEGGLLAVLYLPTPP